MSSAEAAAETRPQSAAAPSPFTPIADYGFLGNFPQAFSHLALIEAAGRIIVAERIEKIS